MKLQHSIWIIHALRNKYVHFFNHLKIKKQLLHSTAIVYFVQVLIIQRTYYMILLTIANQTILWGTLEYLEEHFSTMVKLGAANSRVIHFIHYIYV